MLFNVLYSLKNYAGILNSFDSEFERFLIVLMICAFYYVSTILLQTNLNVSLYMYKERLKYKVLGTKAFQSAQTTGIILEAVKYF